MTPGAKGFGIATSKSIAPMACQLLYHTLGTCLPGSWGVFWLFLSPTRTQTQLHQVTRVMSIDRGTLKYSWWAFCLPPKVHGVVRDAQEFQSGSLASPARSDQLSADVGVDGGGDFCPSDAGLQRAIFPGPIPTP